MKATNTLLVLGLAAQTLAMGVLLPLYIYPSVTYMDNSLKWQPAFAAINDTKAQGFPWIVVVDPWSGPGSQQNNTPTPGYDDNYRYGVSHLNEMGLTYNVKTVGYVHLQVRPVDAEHPIPEYVDETAVKDNITIWQEWNSYTGQNISVQGIFFDEATTSNMTFLGDLTSYARATLGQDITIVCNPGSPAPNETMYELCDVVVCVELGWSGYKGKATLDFNGPHTNEAYIPKTAVLVHDFVGTGGDGATASVETLAAELRTIKSNGTGWTYWTTSSDYGDLTYPAPNITVFAETFASVEASS
jgi:hypothetical protein